ncbi:hypothetical protein MCHK_08545 [Mesorhizobium huakuii 7653R]|nr:hypothetical protein MCHK_08545 [Mesorhizobium huakuii 7653R]
MHVAQKWPRFWEDDMHNTKPAIAALAEKQASRRSPGRSARQFRRIWSAGHA